jgi:hypothetical protein
MTRKTTAWFTLATAVTLIVTSSYGSTTWYVDDDAPADPAPGNPGASDPLEDGSTDHAFDTIQECIDASLDGDACLVLPGTYSEAINFNGKAIALRSTDGPDGTTIDGSGLNESIVRCISGEGPGTVLHGFTITGGHPMTDRGGGMRNIDSSPTVTDCIFKANIGADDGAGMYNESSNPTLTNCRFVENVGGADGGGMFNWNSSPTVINCVFIGNSVTAGSNRVGGGMVNAENSNPMLLNCLFRGNSVGGGSQNNDGGAMFNSNSSPTVINCTFSENTITGGGSPEGAGMSSQGASVPVLTNCIFWGNAIAGSTDESAQISGPATVRFSSIQGCTSHCADPDDRNIGGDPNLDDDLRLSPGSPCIDAGDTAALPGALFVDFAGAGRVLDDPLSPDTGFPASLIQVTVDMGAYEYQGTRNGDLDGDGDVDLNDFSIFQFTGPW